MNDIPTKNKIVFLDFDGTLVDVRKRLYRLFIFLSKTEGLSFGEYWRLKATGLLQKDMLAYVGYEGTHESFSKAWHELVEQKDWLQYDCKYDYTNELMRYLKIEYQCFLWTNRQSRENLLWELEQLGLNHQFERILVTEQTFTKSELIMKTSNHLHNLVIGDTTEDEQAAVANGCEFIHIRDVLQRYRL